MIIATAGAETLQLITAPFDADRFAGWLETQTVGDAIFEQVDVIVLKLNDFVTIGANQMIVMRVIQKVGVVIFVVLAQINLM